MAVLNFQQIAEAFAKNRDYEDVDIPGLGMVRVTMMPAIIAHPLYVAMKELFAEHGREPAKWTADVHRAVLSATVDIIQAGTIDESGEPLFPGDEGRKLIEKFDSDQLGAFRTAIWKVNGLVEAQGEADLGN